MSILLYVVNAIIGGLVIKKEEGLLELVLEADGGKNVMFRDKRTGDVMALAATLNLINKDPALQSQYDIRGHGALTYIRSKKNIENLE